MGKTVKWGILGAARIADSAILPAITTSAHATAVALGARSFERARDMAAKHRIARAYGSYDAVLADGQVEAVYIALPNHLHVEWAAKAAKAGKHVLCEKPAAMKAVELAQLDNINPRLKISEAFMVRHQPRWIELKKILQRRNFGAPLTFSSLLSFKMTNEQDFRLEAQHGGGACYDLGCYTTMAARYVFDCQPQRVFAVMGLNATGIDMFTSALLDFGDNRHASFMVSMAQASAQSIEIVCESGYITLPQAYIPSRTRPNIIAIDTSSDHAKSHIETMEFPPLDQYEAEISNFSRAIRGEAVPYFGINDARANAHVLDALFASAASGNWVEVKSC